MPLSTRPPAARAPSGRTAALVALNLLLGALTAMSLLAAWGSGVNAWKFNTPADAAYGELAGRLVWLWVMLLIGVWFAHFLAPRVLYRGRTLLTVTLAVVAVVFTLSGDYRAKRDRLPQPVPWTPHGSASESVGQVVVGGREGRLDRVEHLLVLRAGHAGVRRVGHKGGARVAEVHSLEHLVARGVELEERDESRACPARWGAEAGRRGPPG